MLYPVSISLGGRSFEVRQLTLDQIRDISVAVSLADTDDQQENVRRSFRRSFATIAAALSTTAPDMTEAEIGKLQATREELNTAYRVILEFSGLIPKGEAPAAP